MGTVLNNRFLTVSEAAAELKLTSQRVRQLISSGQLAGEAVHERLIIIPRKALDEFKTIERPNGYHVDKRPATRPRKSAKRKR